MHAATLQSSHAGVVPKLSKGRPEPTLNSHPTHILMYNMYQSAKGYQSAKYTQVQSGCMYLVHLIATPLALTLAECTTRPSRPD